MHDRTGPPRLHAGNAYVICASGSTLHTETAGTRADCRLTPSARQDRGLGSEAEPHSRSRCPPGSRPCCYWCLLSISAQAAPPLPVLGLTAGAALHPTRAVSRRLRHKDQGGKRERSPFSKPAPAVMQAIPPGPAVRCGFHSSAAHGHAGPGVTLNQFPP